MGHKTWEIERKSVQSHSHKEKFHPLGQIPLEGIPWPYIKKSCNFYRLFVVAFQAQSCPTFAEKPLWEVSLVMTMLRLMQLWLVARQKLEGIRQQYSLVIRVSLKKILFSMSLVSLCRFLCHLWSNCCVLLMAHSAQPTKQFAPRWHLWICLAWLGLKRVWKSCNWPERLRSFDQINWPATAFR